MGRELTTSSTGTAETSNGSFDAVLGNGLVVVEDHGNIVLEVSNGHGRVAGGGLGALGDGEGVVRGSGGTGTIRSTSGVLRNNTGFVSI